MALAASATHQLPGTLYEEVLKFGVAGLGGLIVGVPLYQAKADLFRAVGHPARIRVLELLSLRDHAVHELLEDIAIEPSSLSQQLAVLRRTGLVMQRREGSTVVYCLAVPEVSDLLMAARKVLGQLLSDQQSLAIALRDGA